MAHYYDKAQRLLNLCDTFNYRAGSIKLNQILDSSSYGILMPEDLRTMSDISILLATLIARDMRDSIFYEHDLKSHNLGVYIKELKFVVSQIKL